MSVRAVFEYDPEDHYEAAKAITSSTSARYLRWVMAGAAIALLLWNVAPAWNEYPASTLFWSGLPWLLLAIFWLVFIPLLQKRAARRLPAVDASVTGPQERLVDEFGYHARGNSVAVDIPWHAMPRVVENERLFLFFYTKQFAYYLPKRALSAADVADVRRLARAGFGERAELLHAPSTHP